MGGWRCGYLRRSREGSDYTTINLYFVSHVFQSTLPRRERRPANGRFRCAPPHFNPRSREGSDSTLCGGNLFLICISIHAPAKGATSDASSGSIGRSYFNPRSREGSDQAAAKESRGGGNFNPRSREGSDVGRCNLERLTAISIHAPAKGATYFDYLKVSVRIFQSTLPRRERRASYETRTSGRCYFNPRSREGSDSSANSIINRQTLFQSTLPRGHPPHFHLIHCSISIHAPAKGATILISSHEQDFNPRSREGHACSATACGADCHFNPRSREGSDSTTRIEAVTGFHISIHAPAKGATPAPATVPTSTPFNFNPRSREGSDIKIIVMLVDLTL